jgi:hypothetical protein
MRQFSSNVQTVLDSDVIKFFFLIKLEFSQTYYLTSYHHDILFDGQTYTADGGLFEYDSPKQSSVVDRESYRIVLSDISNTMMQEFKNNVIGKAITVYAGFLDANGAPLTNINDMIIVYKGYVDSPAVENNWDTKLAVLEGTSPMSDLDAVRPFYTSRDGMDQRSATDTTFDDMYQDNEIKLKWGKV